MEGGFNLVRTWLNDSSMVTVSRIVRELHISYENARTLLTSLCQLYPHIKPVHFQVTSTANSCATSMPTLYGVCLEGKETSFNEEISLKRDVYKGREDLVYPITGVGYLEQDIRYSSSRTDQSSLKPVVSKHILKPTSQHTTEKKNAQIDKPTGNIANMLKLAPKLSTEKKAVGFEKPAENVKSAKDNIKRQSTPHPMKTKKESQNLSEFLHSNPLYTIEEDSPMDIEEKSQPQPTSQPKKRKAEIEPVREAKKMKVEPTNKENQTRVIRVKKSCTVLDDQGRYITEDVYEEKVVTAEPNHAIPSKKGTQTSLANFFVRK